MTTNPAVVFSDDSLVKLFNEEDDEIPVANSTDEELYATLDNMMDTALNWIRGTISDYVTLVSPLQALLNQCQVETGSAKAFHITRISLEKRKLLVTDT